MADESVGKSYEEVRKQRVEENKKRFEDLGIAKISKTLTTISTVEKKSQTRSFKPREKVVYDSEPRRSTRARNPISSYSDDLDVELPDSQKRSRSGSRSRSTPSSWATYIARPLEECRSCSYEERAEALKRADEFQTNLQSGHPSFVKSMVRSHVYSCFWLGLPSKFCEVHLPKSTVNVVLENEDGTEYDAVYIGKRAGLSGGWRAFALDYKLNDGDALVFELIEPLKFKIYTFRAATTETVAATSVPSEEEETATGVDNEEATASKRTKRVVPQKNSKPEISEETATEVDHEEGTSSKRTKRVVPQKPEISEKTATEVDNEEATDSKRTKRVIPKKPEISENASKTNVTSKKVETKKENGDLGKKSSTAKKSKKVEEKDKSVTLRPRKKAAERLFRKRA